MCHIFSVMCGRITLRHPNRTITAFLSQALEEVPSPKFNLGPGVDQWVVRRSEEASGGREVCRLHWGFVPGWSREKKPTGIFNARAETVATKPSFRGAFRQRRCLVPVDGFYEWRKVGRERKPVFFSLTEDRPFALAGIWEKWEDGDRVLESFCLLTTEPNELVAAVHDRMPVMLDPERADFWVEGGAEENLARILPPFPAAEMVSRPVSSFVNRIGNEGPDCLAPPEEGEEQLSLF